MGLTGGATVGAAASSTLNFQARLMNGDGSVVPDGRYNIEFKLYDTADAGASSQGVCASDCVWMETRTGSNAVSVVNGYVTVNLGSVVPLGSEINWGEELWLTMNIGGTTGVAKWDGEMSPRLKLTAVPYAFSAGELTQQTGTNTSTLGFATQTSSNSIFLPDESGILCIQGSDDCGFLKGGLQEVYDGSESPKITINAGQGALTILGDPDGLAGTLFEVKSSDGSGAYLGVDSSGVSVGGSLTVATLGVADTANFLCYNSAGQIAACDIAGTMETIAGVLDASSLVFSGETQVFNVDGAVTGVDGYTAIAVDAAVDDLRVTVPAPDSSKQTVGRVLYITGVSDSHDFTIVLDGTGIEVPLGANKTATLVWNGTGWTAANASAPSEPVAETATEEEPYLGSMYYDATTGSIQCYEAEGWGACAAAPDNIVSLSPEYAGSVLNGDGVGAMSTDFCSNDEDLAVNDTLCASGQAQNYYKWTSPESSQQTRSIYVTYQLPANFKGFASDDTVRLAARVDNADNAAVTYEMYRSTGSDIVRCASDGAPTNVISGGGGGANLWHAYGINGNEATGCGFDSSAAGSSVIFKINLTASQGASAYVGTLSFVTTTR